MATELELERATRWARRHDVCSHTEKRWEQDGLIEPARRIKGIRYRRRDEQPRFDDEQDKA